MMQQQQGSSGHQEEATLDAIATLQEEANATAPTHEEFPLCGRRVEDQRPQEPAAVSMPRRQHDTGRQPKLCSMCCVRRPPGRRRRTPRDRKLEDPLESSAGESPMALPCTHVCDICMAEVPELAPFGEACAHTFCAECLARCLEHGVNRCPTCRAPRFIDEAEAPSSISNLGESSSPPMLDRQLCFFVGRLGSQRWQLATLCSAVACAFVMYLAIVFIASGPHHDSRRDQQRQPLQRPLHSVVPALSRWLHSPGLHPVHMS